MFNTFIGDAVWFLLCRSKKKKEGGIKIAYRLNIISVCVCEFFGTVNSGAGQGAL